MVSITWRAPPPWTYAPIMVSLANRIMWSSEERSARDVPELHVPDVAVSGADVRQAAVHVRDVGVVEHAHDDRVVGHVLHDPPQDLQPIGPGDGHRVLVDERVE